jgi:hypothetical protein
MITMTRRLAELTVAISIAPFSDRIIGQALSPRLYANLMTYQLELICYFR